MGNKNKLWRVLYSQTLESVIRRTTTSGQTETTSRQTSTTNGQMVTTSGQTNTTSGQTITTSGYKSSHHMCSIKKVLLKFPQISQENTCVGVSFQQKSCNFIKKRLQQSCFPVKFTKILKSICERLLLWVNEY